MGRWSTHVLLAYVALLLTGCMFKGPSFNAEHEGALSCAATMRENETIVVYGDSCLIEHLSPKMSQIRVIPTSEVSGITFPSFSGHGRIRSGYQFSPQDVDIPILSFLREHDTEDVIRENQIRYIIYVAGNATIEPMPTGWSAEDFQGAVFGIYRKETATYSALIVDAGEVSVSGSLLQETEATNVTIPLLVFFSDPDPAKAACKAIASSIEEIIGSSCQYQSQ
jgi:hypothetical protein